jgi:hypothetical protein
VRVFGVDFDFVVAIGGLGEIVIGAYRGAFGDEMAGVQQGMFRGVDARGVGDRLVHSVLSVLHDFFL